MLHLEKKRLRFKKCKKSKMIKMISIYHPSLHPCGLYLLSCIGHPCDLSIYLSIYRKNNELKNLKGLKSKMLSIIHSSRPSVRTFDLPACYLSIYLSIYLSVCVSINLHSSEMKTQIRKFEILSTRPNLFYCNVIHLN